MRTDHVRLLVSAAWSILGASCQQITMIKGHLQILKHLFLATQHCYWIEVYGYSLHPIMSTVLARI